MIEQALKLTQAPLYNEFLFSTNESTIFKKICIFGTRIQVCSIH